MMAALPNRMGTSPGQPGAWLAIDTSTEQLSVALQTAERVLTVVGKGAAQSSASLIPTVLDLLAQAQLKVADLQGIAFGRGPGSFTGLRTACAVAQGLAFGAGLPLLPLDTLLAVAEAARQAHRAKTGTSANPSMTVLAMLDARMDEVYAALWRWMPALDQPGHAEAGTWTELEPVGLASPAQVRQRAQALVASHAAEPSRGELLAAGNAFGVGESALPAGLQCVEALPMADAMLRLVPQALQAGHLVQAQDALPLYIRDKVAKTTEERQLERLLGSQPSPPP
jgi:tRNA threonylcarbamoyladenosine biosynthesis protein TsaB